MNDIKKSDLTFKQQSFVSYLVAENKNPTEACRLAGYSYPKETAYKLTRNPAVINLIQQERRRLYSTDLSIIAVNTLKNIMQDVDAPASARVSASRTALELAGDIGKNAIDSSDGKDLSELTPDQLGRLIDNWEEQRSKVAKPIN
tara:strand:+ start:756 stop:1190 length:435 start_codon:yes stop_codon:yes gene_type:complete